MLLAPHQVLVLRSLTEVAVVGNELKRSAVTENTVTVTGTDQRSCIAQTAISVTHVW